jgi:hypothetical protein
VSLETTTPAAEGGPRVTVLYRCHTCSQGSHLVEVPAADPRAFAASLNAAVAHHHSAMSPSCPARRVQVRVVSPPPA